MKIYRCVLGFLMVFFIMIGVWYVVSNLDEQRSVEDGLLIWHVEEELNENIGNEAYVGSDIRCHR